MNLQISPYQRTIKQLNVNDQLEVWGWVLGDISLGQQITSPFRPDTIPRCVLREYNGIVYFTDGAYPKYNKYTCIHAIANLKGCTLTQAANIIYSNKFFNKIPDLKIKKLRKGKIIKLQKGNKPIIPVYHRYNKKPCWTKIDKAYWKSRCITIKDLERANIFSVHSFYVGNSYIVPSVYPCFALPTLSGRMKIYQPYSKDHKWISNTTKDDIWKIEGEVNICVIVSSLKDALHWAKYTPYHVHAFQSEAIFPKDNDYSNFDYIIINYDNDFTGILSTYKLLNYLQYKYCKTYFFPQNIGKDPDEAVLKVGPVEFKKLIKYL